MVNVWSIVLSVKCVIIIRAIEFEWNLLIGYDLFTTSLKVVGRNRLKTMTGDIFIDIFCLLSKYYADLYLLWRPSQRLSSQRVIFFRFFPTMFIVRIHSPEVFKKHAILQQFSQNSFKSKVAPSRGIKFQMSFFFR